MTAAAHERLTYSMGEAGDVLGVSIWSIRNLVRSNELRSVRAGDRILIPRDAVRDFLAGKRPPRSSR